MELEELKKPVAVTLNLPAELVQKIDALANAEVRSRTGQVIKLLLEHPSLGDGYAS